MADTHIVYLFDDYGRFMGEQTLALSAPHPRRFTDIAPTLEENKISVFNFTSWVNVDMDFFKLSLDTLKADAIKRLRDFFNAKIDLIKSDNAQYEIDTWPIQNAEWTAWVANNTAPTPYVDALSAARGVDKPTLMGKIGYKSVGVATIQGTQHGLEDQIKAATTEEELLLVKWDI